MNISNTSNLQTIGESMKLLFDAFWIVDGPPSGKTVVREIIQTWIREFPEDNVSLLVRKSDLPAVEDLGLGGSRSVTLVASRAPIHALAVCALRIKPGIDAVITQNFTPLIPHRALKATFLHDGIFRQYPQWFTSKERMYLSLATLSIRSARLVLTSTITESRRIKRYFGSTRHKTRAVGLGLPSWILNRTKTDLDSPTPSKPYLLAVGRLNIRKNIQALMDAYEITPEVERDFDLYIVGEPDGKNAALGRKSSSIHFMSGVSDSRLRSLYEGAAGFVFPSLDEGFGLPLLEAASFGLPTAASDLEVFREIDLAHVYFDPKSVDSISAALRRLVATSDGSVSKELKQRRSRAMEKYQWTTVVGNIREALLVEGVN